MFRAGDCVEVISDGRIGTINKTNGRIDAANMPGGVEVVENCLVVFGTDIGTGEWFEPEQLRLAG
jgi:hypothetical protein